MNLELEKVIIQDEPVTPFGPRNQPMKNILKQTIVWCSAKSRAWKMEQNRGLPFPTTKQITKEKRGGRGNLQIKNDLIGITRIMAYVPQLDMNSEKITIAFT